MAYVDLLCMSKDDWVAAGGQTLTKGTISTRAILYKWQIDDETGRTKQLTTVTTFSNALENVVYYAFSGEAEPYNHQLYIKIGGVHWATARPGEYGIAPTAYAAWYFAHYLSGIPIYHKDAQAKEAWVKDEGTLKKITGCAVKDAGALKTVF